MLACAGAAVADTARAAHALGLLPWRQPAPQRRERPRPSTRRRCAWSTRCGARAACARCAPTGNWARGRQPGHQHGALELLRRRPSVGADADVARRRHPLSGARRAVRGRAEHRLGHRQLHDAGAHRGGMDGVPSAPRNHAQRRVPRRRRRRHAGRAGGPGRARPRRHLRDRVRRAALLR